MKNLWIAALAAVLLVSCGGRESQNRNEQTTKTEKKMGVRHLTKAEFLTKVANYEASPKEWKFLGDKPCIVDFYASWCGPCRASLPRNLEVYRDKIAPRKDLEVVLCSMDHALEGAQKWAVSNKMPWPVFLFGYLDNLSKESPLIRKNYPGPITSLVLVDSNGNKIASGSMDGLVRKVEELASAEKEKEATAESE